MRIIAMILGLSLASITTVADDHGGKMALEARQPDSTMNVTSVNVGTDQTTITASGKMGAYGKVYTTYNLTYGADRSSGFVEGNGRGVIDAETVVSGYFVGVWHREGSTIVMHNTVHVSDGSQNFDVIRFDARGETFATSGVHPEVTFKKPHLRNHLGFFFLLKTTSNVSSVYLQRMMYSWRLPGPKLQSRLPQHQTLPKIRHHSPSVCALHSLAIFQHSEAIYCWD